jgi:hypothetical protein
VLALTTLPSTACLSVHYQARQSLPGSPSSPAMHAEGVAIRDMHATPDTVALGNGTWARPSVTRDGVTNEPITPELDRTLVLSVRLAAGARTEILDMTWSPASAPRCAGGHPALAILTDAEGELNSALAERPQVRWERPLVLQGDQVLSGRFDEDPPLLHQASVVDVRVATFDTGARRETCVRVPMIGPGITFRNLKRWSVGARLSWRRALPFTRSSVMLLGLSGGRWVGPVRLGLEGMVGGTNDGGGDGPHGTGLCFLLSGPDCDSISLAVVGMEASGVAWRRNRWALGWSVAYQTFFASIKPMDHDAIGGGPRLAVQVLRAASDVGGISTLSPTSAWGFELYAAHGQTWSGGGSGTPFTYGVSVLGF